MEKKWNKTYNQNGFNLENARKMELNAEDLMILRWFLDFYPLMEKVCNDNKEYGWVHYGYLLHNLQIIYCKEESVAKRFNRYCELGLIEKIVKNTTKGRKAYFRAVANITLLYTSHTDKNLDAHNDKNLDAHNDKNLDNSFTIYPSTINLNKDTASGLSQNENPTVKDSLQVQKPKKEIDFPQEFVEYYEAYTGLHPSKQKQTASTALTKWKIMRKTHTNAEILLQIQKYAEYLQKEDWRQKKGMQFVNEKFLFEGDWIEKKLIQEEKQQKSTNNNNYGKQSNRTPTTRDFLRSYEKQYATFDPTSDIE